MLRYMALIALTVSLFCFCSPSGTSAGKHLELNDIRSPRVIGGMDAQTHEFPWMVLIRLADSPMSMRTRKLCGGAIISQNWIVTSARCSANSRRNYRVSAGVLDSSFPNMADEQSRRVQQIIVHPAYNSTTFANDIALWKVFPPFVLTGAAVKSIPYAHFNFFANGTGVVVGWGDRSESDPNGPRLLQKGDVNILTNVLCQSRHAEARTNVNVSDSHICADTISGGPCKGDHGGPLMSVRNGIKVLIGIVSSTWNCMRTGPPRLYTRTSTYYDWIHVQTTS